MIFFSFKHDDGGGAHLSQKDRLNVMILLLVALYGFVIPFVLVNCFQFCFVLLFNNYLQLFRCTYGEQC